MENLKQTVDKRTRKSLSRGTRIYRISYGIAILIIGVILIVKNGFALTHGSSILGEGAIIIGFFSIIYGVIGKNLTSQRIQIYMDEKCIRIKKPFERELLIKLESITYLKALPFKLEICYDDFAKTYDFSYLTEKEFEKIKEKIVEYCSKKNIDIE